MWPFKKKPCLRQHHDPQDVAIARAHLNTIMEIANRHTGSGKTHGRRSDQISVVVPYEDMLRIWDLADRAIWRL